VIVGTKYTCVSCIGHEFYLCCICRIGLDGIVKDGSILKTQHTLNYPKDNMQWCVGIFIYFNSA